MADHARLSASGSHIWLNCTPAVKLSEGIPDKGSIYTAEGTLAHRVAEIELGKIFGVITERQARDWTKLVAASEFYTPELIEYVQRYVDWVQETYNAIRSEDKELLTEQRLDFSTWVPQGFGTGDVVIIADGVLTVIDLKYGKGVPVDAFQNPQLMLYGLGAYDSFSLSNDIDTIRMIINQPRLDSISENEISVEDLLKWGDEVVKPRAEMAMKGEGEACPGDWCRFCKVKATCRARAEEALEMARYEFEEPKLLDEAEIGDVLSKVDRIASWISDVKEYAQAEALQGRKWPGWKLVEGRSNRKYSDPKEVEKRLLAAGFEKVLLFKDPELLGITAMEKVVGGKKKLEKLCEGLIVKPPGAPTLVPATDKRPEISPAKSDFDDDDDALPFN